MFNAYLTYSVCFISCVIVTREQLMLWPKNHLCLLMPLGRAGTAAGGQVPLSLEVLGVGRGDGMLENSCRRCFLCQ